MSTYDSSFIPLTHSVLKNTNEVISANDDSRLLQESETVCCKHTLARVKILPVPMTTHSISLLFVVNTDQLLLEVAKTTAVVVNTNGQSQKVVLQTRQHQRKRWQQQQDGIPRLAPRNQRRRN